MCLTTPDDRGPPLSPALVRTWLALMFGILNSNHRTQNEHEKGKLQKIEELEGFFIADRNTERETTYKSKIILKFDIVTKSEEHQYKMSEISKLQNSVEYSSLNKKD